METLNRYRKAVLVALLALAAILAASLFIDNLIEINSLSLQTVNSVASIATAVLLFGVTWSLHQHFGASQQTVDKKAEKVLSLLAFLQNIQLEIHYNERPGYSYNYGHRPVSEKLDKSINDIVIKNKSKVKNKHYFDESVIDLYQEMSSFAEDIFMPKNISKLILDKIDMKSLFAFEGVDRKDIDYYDLVVYAKKIPRSNFSHFEEITDQDAAEAYGKKSSNKLVSSYNDLPANADRLIDSIYSIHECAMNWLRKNSPYVIEDLNID